MVSLFVEKSVWELVDLSRLVSVFGWEASLCSVGPLLVEKLVPIN